MSLSLYSLELTPRVLEVAVMRTNGMSVPAIAEALGKSRSTVVGRLSLAHRWLQVRNQIELANKLRGRR